MTQLYQPYANSIVYTQYPWQEASMRSIALSLTGAYRIPDTGFSFSGSVDWVKVRQVSLSLGSGNGHLGIGDSPLARLTSEGSSPMSNSYHVAAGYQYDPLALKLLLSYHAKAGYQHHLTQNFFVSGKHPSEITFDAQMGISPTTLLTTGVMYNQYKGSNVYLNGPSPHTPFQLTHFGNSAAYKVGVGHKLSQTLSMGLGLQYSPGSSKTGDDFLSPTNGSTAIQLGLNYKLASATVSTSYSSVYFGDKIVGPSSPEIAYLSSILYNSFNSGVQPFNPTLAFKNSRANIPSVTVSYRY